MKARTKAVYRQTCECGIRLEFTKSQAGSVLTCQSCFRTTSIHSLSVLNRVLPIEKRIPCSPPIQFTLKQVLLLFVPFSIASCVVNMIGPELTFLVVLPCFVYFGFLYGIAFFIHKFPRWRNSILDKFCGAIAKGESDQGWMVENQEGPNVYDSLTKHIKCWTGYSWSPYRSTRSSMLPPFSTFVKPSASKVSFARPERIPTCQ